jgi:hypothetical protein
MAHFAGQMMQISQVLGGLGARVAAIESRDGPVKAPQPAAQSTDALETRVLQALDSRVATRVSAATELVTAAASTGKDESKKQRQLADAAVNQRVEKMVAAGLHAQVAPLREILRTTTNALSAQVAALREQVAALQCEVEAARKTASEVDVRSSEAGPAERHPAEPQPSEQHPAEPQPSEPQPSQQDPDDDQQSKPSKARAKGKSGGKSKMVV